MSQNHGDMGSFENQNTNPEYLMSRVEEIKRWLDANLGVGKWKFMRDRARDVWTVKSEVSIPENFLREFIDIQRELEEGLLHNYKVATGQDIE